MECYQTAMNISEIVSKVYITMLSSISILAIAPYIQTVYTVRGNYSDENYLLPILCTLPFKMNSWKKYTIGFLWTYSSFTAMIICKLIVSPIMYTLSFYIIAVIRHLCQTATELNFNKYKKKNSVDINTFLVSISLNLRKNNSNICKDFVKFFKFNVDLFR